MYESALPCQGLGKRTPQTVLRQMDTCARQASGDATQVRAFEYFQSGLLRSATNPELGQVQYEYTPGGRLLKKISAKGRVVCIGACQEKCAAPVSIWRGGPCRKAIRLTTTMG